MNDPTQERRLKTAIETQFSGSDLRPAMDLLRSMLPPGARILAAGGILRNIIIRQFHGDCPPPHDIDLFIGNLAPGVDLSETFAAERFEKAELGGIRWRPAGLRWAIDLCRIEDFLVIRHHHLDPTPERLLAAIDFDVNAVTYDLDLNILRESGCFRAIRRRTMGFNSRLFSDKALLGYRVLLVRHRIDFRLSENIFNFLKSAIDMETLSAIESILRVKVDSGLAEELIASFDRICRHRTYAAYLKGEG